MVMSAARSKTLIAISVLVLLAGLAVDLAQVRPLLGRVRQLETSRQTALEGLQQRQEREAERQLLASALLVTDLDELRQLRELQDPIVFLGKIIDGAGLARQELSSTGTTDSVRLRRSDFTLRATGQYAQVVELLRLLEQNPRLVTVDALQVGKGVAQSELECRLNLSVFDPLPEAGP